MPGKGRPFKKGVSPNPSGRPKGVSIVARLNELAKEIPPGERETRAELVARKLFELSVAGDLDAIKYLSDRLHGRIKDAEDDSQPNPLSVLTDQQVALIAMGKASLKDFLK